MLHSSCHVQLLQAGQAGLTEDTTQKGQLHLIKFSGFLCPELGFRLDISRMMARQRTDTEGVGEGGRGGGGGGPEKI